jgi:hypothetical protein
MRSSQTKAIDSKPLLTLELRTIQCGNSSVVEHNLAKVGVASSSLVSRSSIRAGFHAMSESRASPSLAEVSQIPSMLPGDLRNAFVRHVRVAFNHGHAGPAA